MSITGWGNQTGNTVLIWETGIRETTITITVAIIVIVGNSTVTTGADISRCVLLTIAMASQTTDTGIATVAVVTAVFGYVYTPPFREL